MDYKLSEMGISFGRYGCDTHTAGAGRHIHDKIKKKTGKHARHKHPECDG